MILVRAQKMRMLPGMQTVKAGLMRLQWGIRTPLALGLEAMYITYWQKICLLFAHVLRLQGIEIKRG